MSERLFFLIMRGRTLAQARPVLVSEDGEFVRDAVAFAGNRLNVEVEKVLGPLPCPKLVTDVHSHGHYDDAEGARSLELEGVEDGMPAVRDRVEAAERAALRSSEKQMTELHERAGEAERYGANAEEGLVEAEKALHRTGVESSRALNAWQARTEKSDE